MTTRELIISYFAHISAGRFTEAAACFAPDARHWISGEGSWPLGGTHDAAGLRRIHLRVAERFPSGLAVTVRSIVVEGDRAAVELEGYGVRVDGRTYNNRYHYAMVIRDGLIVERHEYLDCIHANDLLCGPMGPPTG